MNDTRIISSANATLDSAPSQVGHGDEEVAETAAGKLTLELQVNGEARTVNCHTLGALLASLGYGETRIATAVNGVFVAAPERASCNLSNGDRVEIVAPRQGG